MWIVIELASRLWALLGGDHADVDALTLTGPARVLPSVYDVTGFAAASVGVAGLAAAELLAARTGRSPLPAVAVDSRQASAAFLCESLFKPQDWERPAMWDPIAGDYRAADGWIRLHTNYASHRAAALRALGLTEADRDAVAVSVSGRQADELEQTVVQEGGCAAVLRSRDDWLRHPHGRAVRAEPPVAIVRLASSGGSLVGSPGRARALEGVKVLDLTRVIAGPVCTRYLAGLGAQVLRIDPPEFVEVPALVHETTAGKRTAHLDLGSAGGRGHFSQLLGEADVVVQGLRPGALAGLGFDSAAMRAVNPGLVIAGLDAYGWTGPWAGRRGFDSLVQMSCGIAAAGAAALGVDRPVPLPAQALDHGTGFLLAAAVCRALTQRQRDGAPADVTAALVGTANLLSGLADPGGLDQPPPTWTDDDTQPRLTAWGPARAVPIPGVIDGVKPKTDIEPGPIGRHTPTWRD